MKIETRYICETCGEGCEFTSEVECREHELSQKRLMAEANRKNKLEAAFLGERAPDDIIGELGGRFVLIIGKGEKITARAIRAMMRAGALACDDAAWKSRINDMNLYQ